MKYISLKIKIFIEMKIRKLGSCFFDGNALKKTLRKMELSQGSIDENAFLEKYNQK